MVRFGLLGSGLIMGLGFLSIAIHFVLWIVLIMIVVRLFRSHKDRHHGVTRPNDYALEILRERFAKGEIDVEEFNRKKEDLSRKD
ncbi:SHOCT domain-containing protein [Desulfosporosinus sp. FKB]|uniref:SHOCT domain-containing protein n=1 Tax=Desulfosporosinus sp. FKB TaxID=1969835 RepID=UPI000B49A4A0|nr:SHOCT domain-containing protein [Desulfosporosinus sp. FKB]